MVYHGFISLVIVLHSTIICTFNHCLNISNMNINQHWYSHLVFHEKSKKIVLLHNFPTDSSKSLYKELPNKYHTLFPHCKNATHLNVMRPKPSL